MKKIRYRVFGIIDFDAESPEIDSVLEHIQGWGDAVIVGVELVDEDAELPKDLQADYEERTVVTSKV